MNGFAKAFLQTLALVVGVLFLFFYAVTLSLGWLLSGGFLLVIYFMMRLSKSPPKSKAPEWGEWKGIEHE